MNDYDRLINRKWQAVDRNKIFDMPFEIAERFIRASWRKHMGTKFPYAVRKTSGNRHTWVRCRVCYINTEKGWKDAVHSWSHWLGYRKGLKPHGDDHMKLEKELTIMAIDKYVGVKPKPKPAQPSVVERRALSVNARIKRWEAKCRRAENALKKLRNQKRYYDKKLGVAG